VSFSTGVESAGIEAKIMKRVLVVLLVCCSGIAGAQNTVARIRTDGDWWRTLPESIKLGYVIGYTDAYCSALQIVNSANEKKGVHITRAPNLVFVCDFPPNFTYARMVEAANRFYSDDRNGPILTDFVFIFMKRAVLGTPVTDAELVPIRKTAAKDKADKAKATTP
jgi:hypothetical protein